MTNKATDWPPASSASALAEGVYGRGSTGQLWQVQSGTWVRVNEGDMWRHVKRGTYYNVLASNVMIQCSTTPEFEEKYKSEKWTVYINVVSDGLYVRPTAEFLDGRFQSVADFLPHAHVPDLSAMGDCAICGKSRSDAKHTSA